MFGLSHYRFPWCWWFLSVWWVSFLITSNDFTMEWALKQDNHIFSIIYPYIKTSFQIHTYQSYSHEISDMLSIYGVSFKMDVKSIQIQINMMFIVLELKECKGVKFWTYIFKILLLYCTSIMHSYWWDW